MIYSIKILQKVIDEHVKAIEKLESEDDWNPFNEEEIKERKEYINQLKEAVRRLNECKI